jgi:hypothetical protein
VSDDLQRREFLQRLSATGVAVTTAGMVVLPVAAKEDKPTGQKRKICVSVFTLTEEQEEKLEVWRQEQDRKVMEAQKGTECEQPGRAYYGAIGGAYTYSFAPTGIGDVVKVTNSETKETIDLSDYELW